MACWLAWHLEEAGPGITRVTLTADTLPCDPPVDTATLLSSLKRYLEIPARHPGSADALLSPLSAGAGADRPGGRHRDTPPGRRLTPPGRWG